MRQMIVICESFACEYDLLFNPLKSKLMFYNITYDDLHVELCSQPVNIVNHETYLGNYIGADIFDRAVTQTVCKFNQRSNHVIADFSMLDFFRYIHYIVHIV